MSDIAIRHRLEQGSFTLDVDTQIPAKGITGIFGASGSGKTSLLRCIAGLEKSTSLDRRPPHRRRIGMVFQEPRLFSHLNVRRNIEYGLRRQSAVKNSMDEVIRMLELKHLVDRRVSNLSGGEAQRVAIARVLCQAPDLILMDEPFSALEQRRKDELLPFLDRLHAESSIPMIYVSHNIDEISRLADYLLLIEGGRIIASGDLQSMLSRLDLPQLGGRNAGAVIEAQRLRYDAKFDLTLFEFSGGNFWVPGSYAANATRLRVSASDVSLALQPPVGSTILNVLPAVIDATEVETNATQIVRLRVGEDYLLASITRRSWQQLGLAVGDRVFAQMKSVTVRR
jgi:molybdate transport system ATP-binding protein